MNFIPALAVFAFPFLGLQEEGSEDTSTWVVVEGARILPVAGDPIDDGVLLIRDGSIYAVGVAGDVEVPEGAQRIDGTGLVLSPGLVDAGAYLPTGSTNHGRSGPGHDTFEDFNAYATAEQFREMLRSGVTAAHITPRTIGSVGCSSSVVKIRPGEAANDWLVRRGALLNSRLNDPADPFAPTKDLDALAKKLREARGAREKQAKAVDEMEEYADEVEEFWEDWDKAKKKEEKDRKKAEEKGEEPKKTKYPKPPKKPKPAKADPDRDALLAVVEGRRALRVWVHDAGLIDGLVEVALDTGADLVLVGATGLAGDLEPLEGRRIPVLLGPVELTERSRRGVLQDHDPALAGRLEAADIPVAITAGGDSRFLALRAAQAMPHGLSEAGALSAITLNAARAAGVGGRLGSLEPGKDADFVLWTGHPLRSGSRVQRVFINGEEVQL